jgi:CBS domain-containing protein
MHKVKDIMTADVVFVDPDDRVERAIGLMLRHGVSGLPVVDSSGQLLGVVTEYDILGIVDDFFTEKNKVYHYMTRDIRTIDADASVSELATIFRERSIRRYPVVEDGRLVGIISRRELIRLVHDVRAEPRQEVEMSYATT